MTPPVTTQAIEAARQYFGYPLPPADASYVLEAAKHIDMAISAERERCALIAEGVFYHPHPDLCEEEEGWNDAATHIATAIRATEVGNG